MSNGFLTSRPTFSGAGGQISGGNHWMWAVKFVMPDSGTLNIDEIGLGMDTQDTWRMCIYTHHSGDDRPDQIVANSDIEFVAKGSGTGAIIYETYSTKPQVAGGDTYWIAFYSDASAVIDLYEDTTGTAHSYRLRGSDITVPKTYPTWGTGADWENHGTDYGASGTFDYEFYAVYSSASSPGTHCWGHETGIEEDFAANFSEGSGDATVSSPGAGDGEYITVLANQDWTSLTKETGSIVMKLQVDKYSTPGSGTGQLQYRTHSTQASCETESWSDIAEGVDLTSQGWVQVRIQNY